MRDLHPEAWVGVMFCAGLLGAISMMFIVDGQDFGMSVPYAIGFIFLSRHASNLRGIKK